MEARQAREIDSLRRITHFAEMRGAGTPELANEPRFAALLGELGEARTDVDHHARAQYAGRETALQRRRDRNGLRAEIRELYLEPLHGFAEELAADERYQLERERFRLPAKVARLETFRAAAHAMLETATAVKDGLLAHGMPAAFLDELAAALGRLERAIADHARERARVLEAKVGLAAALDRGWRAVKQLDLYFRTHRRHDEELLSAWREAHQSRSGSRGKRSQGPGSEGGGVSGTPLGAASDAQRPAA